MNVCKKRYLFLIGLSFFLPIAEADQYDAAHWGLSTVYGMSPAENKQELMMVHIEQSANPSVSPSPRLITAKVCPPGYYQQVYVVPVAYIGSAYPGGAGSAGGTSPLYGAQGYATPSPNGAKGMLGNVTGWNVGIRTYNLAGKWQDQPGYVAVYQQCCNPNAGSCTEYD